ncbi:MAG: MASE3 domain-containing protein [Desulfobulbaceae bacterium]|nr:MASE3 domain-containing protein [Desulfobulbaceae bacterium]
MKSIRNFNNTLPITAGNMLALAVLVAVLYFSALHDFLLFHTLAEFFSIVIAFGIFIVAWNTKHLQKNGYLVFLGIAYLFIGFLDMAHTITYKGMMIFTAQNADTPTQLWIIARYFESISLLIAPVFLTRKIKPYPAMTLYTLGTVLLLWSVHKEYFPECYVEGVGLTPFKINSEYIICFILLGAFFMLRANRERFSTGIFQLLAASIVLTIGAELAFTFYVSVYGFSNFVGHLLKFLSYYLIYKALLETGLKEPYELLFKELTDSEKKYRKLFSHMLDGFAYSRVILDNNNLPADHLILEVNDYFEKMIGRPRKEIIGKTITDIFPGIENSNYDWIGRFGNVALTGETLRSEQYFEITDRWYSFSVYSPEPGYLAVIFEDITERKLAELKKEEYLKKVNTLMAELERSNQDLQQFANIVSHDLQEPLRTVSSFVQLLRRRYEGKLDDKADSYINFVVQGTEQMNILLNDLLSFARLGGGRLHMQPQDLENVLNKALMNLSKTIEKKHAAITYKDLPVITADATQMVQLFQNLIANALKFNDRKNPAVDVTAELKENEWVIRVRDNGIGINEKDRERIFLVFQRLHRREEYEGTGIGLALCKKIVERHGGRIWVESVPGAGSSFFFTLPLRNNMEKSRQ